MFGNKENEIILIWAKARRELSVGKCFGATQAKFLLPMLGSGNSSAYKYFNEFQNYCFFNYEKKMLPVLLEGLFHTTYVYDHLRCCLTYPENLMASHLVIFL